MYSPCCILRHISGFFFVFCIIACSLFHTHLYKFVPTRTIQYGAYLAINICASNFMISPLEIAVGPWFLLSVDFGGRIVEVAIQPPLIAKFYKKLFWQFLGLQTSLLGPNMDESIHERAQPSSLSDNCMSAYVYMDNDVFYACVGTFGHRFSYFKLLFWLRITDEGSVPEMRISSILLIKSVLKWCIHLSRRLSLYLFF